MLLAIDIGNSNIVACVFNGSKPVRTIRFSTTDDPALHLAKLSRMKISSSVICSVVPKADKQVDQAIHKLFGIKSIFLYPELFRQFFSIKLKNVSQIGVDRLVNVFAAKKLYGYPLVIIDFGTATTFCTVNSAGAYLGGAIAPGVKTSRDALHEKTAKLPLVELSFPNKLIGNDTKSAMMAGIVYGYIGIVEYIVREYKKILGKKTKIIATGGLSPLIMKGTDIIDINNESLTVQGIRLVWEEICQKKTKRLGKASRQKGSPRRAGKQERR